MADLSTQPLETAIDKGFHKFTEGLKQADVDAILSTLKGKQDNDKKDRLILTTLETEAQNRAYQDWKKLVGTVVPLIEEDDVQMSLERVNDILGRGFIHSDDLVRLLYKLKDPSTRRAFTQWCEEAFGGQGSWPEGYIFDEARRLLSRESSTAPTEEKSLAQVDDFVVVPPQTTTRESSLRQSSNDQSHAPQRPLDEGRLKLSNDGRIGTDLIEKGSTKHTSTLQEEEAQKLPLKKEDKSVTEATADWSVSAVVKPSTHRGTKLSNGTRGIKLGDMSLSRETKQRRGTEEEEKEEDEDEENESDSEKEIPKKEKASPQRDLETYNILIVGDSGVGKTTFINGLANYVGFDTWEEALRYGPDILVKTQFTLVNKDMKPVTVLGRCSFEETKDEKRNENLGSSGESVTQKPVTHTLIWKGKTGSVNVNLIDTPGMNDTRGSKQDQYNLQKILDHVRELKQLNAIVLLLSADQPRMTPQFRHSLNEFLANFDKSSLGNLIFCFTKTRPFGYRPGDAMPVLREYLGEQMKRCGADVLLERENVFCFDNECFRYMCMTKQFPDCGSSDLNKEFRDCWEHNKIEIKRLMRKISKLEAYKLNELTDFSKLREIVDSLSFHQAKFSQRIVQCNKEYESIFAQMGDNYGQCTTDAGHHYTDTRRAETRVNDVNERLLAAMKAEQAEQEELKQERRQILDLCAEVRIHIKYKSPTMPADSFRMFLIRLIEDVESKQRQGGSFPEIVRDLQSVLEYYDRKVVEIGDAVEAKTRNILTEYEIQGKLLDLRRLKHYGEFVVKARKSVQSK